MRPDPTYLAQTKEFWAHIRTISQQVGYTQRGEGTIKVPTLAEIGAAFLTLGLSTTHIVSKQAVVTPFGQAVLSYFAFRARILNGTVQNQLMDRAAAESSFVRLKRQLNPRCPLPMNKQSGEKKNFAFFTGIVNMLIEAGISNSPCDYDPRALTTITRDAMPLRTLARRAGKGVRSKI